MPRRKGRDSPTLFEVDVVTPALRQQNKNCNSGGCNRQKSLPDSRNKMNRVHVNAPLTGLIEKLTECAAWSFTTNRLSDQPLRETKPPGWCAPNNH